MKYATMFHMTNDSHMFRTQVELEGEDEAYPIEQNKYRNAAGDWVPLYAGRMIHIFDHRAASVRVNEANLHNAALSGNITVEEKAKPDFVTTPQYWVPERAVALPTGLDWVISFRDIARATDARTLIVAALPRIGAGNTLPLILPDEHSVLSPALLGNLCSIGLDYVVRQKAQSTHLNWYIVEQLPVIPPDTYNVARFGNKTALEIVTETVLELTYTAHDMAPFAVAMGYVNENGSVKPPFVWDEDRRLHLRAKLDALYFHLYGVTDRDDVRYIYSTFPIVEREETGTWGSYRSRDLCLHYMNALAAGHPDAVVEG
ncbi:hypothetical protein [Mesorhizobium sp. M0800]|uniref:hypothetical protein n=1 Tax=Mesorhizobium sp. M0800 TaxID=2957000 RepID=UPI00333A4A1B